MEEKCNITKEVLAVQGFFVVFFTTLITLILTYRDHTPIINQLKEITIDPLVMEFLDYFHSDEQFLRFLVPETDQENYYCDSYYYTRRNYLKRARTNQNGPGGFIQFLIWDIEVSREELLNQFIPILYGLLDQRMMHLDKGIICPLWRIRTITRSKNSS